MISHEGQDRLEIKQGGGWLFLFGLPFLAIGLFVMINFQTIPFKDKHGVEQSPLVGLLFGAIFAIVGCVVCFARFGTIIDRRHGTVTTWWGLLVPWRSKSRSLSSFSQVTVSSEVRRTKKSSYLVYPVRLHGLGGNSIELEAPRNPEPARQAAERFAKFVELPLMDTTYGSPIVRQPHELDESLRDRARRTGVKPEIPKTPPGVRSSYRIEGDTLVLEIPPGGVLRQLSLPLGLGVVVPMIAGAVFFSDIDLGDMSRQMTTLLWIAAGFMVGVPLLAMLLPALHRGMQRTYVELTPAMLTVNRHSPLYRSTTQIPADELEELEIVWGSNVRWTGPSHAILARSDNAAVQFGEGLSREELHWLRDVVHAMVTA